jgi:hypothetical protein
LTLSGRPGGIGAPTGTEISSSAGQLAKVAPDRGTNDPKSIFFSAPQPSNA